MGGERPGPRYRLQRVHRVCPSAAHQPRAERAAARIPDDAAAALVRRLARRHERLQHTEVFGLRDPPGAVLGTAAPGGGGGRASASR